MIPIALQDQSVKVNKHCYAARRTCVVNPENDSSVHIDIVSARPCFYLETTIELVIDMAYSQLVTG